MRKTVISFLFLSCFMLMGNSPKQQTTEVGPQKGSIEKVKTEEVSNEENSNEASNETNNCIIDEEYLKTLDLNVENLRLVLGYYGVRHSEVVLKQAILESAWFNSPVYKRTNNLFGMKHPRIRKTVSLGRGQSGYATYEHWIYSVKDYKLWQDLKEIKTDYYTYLVQRKYAEAPHYIRSLKSINV